MTWSVVSANFKTSFHAYLSSFHCFFFCLGEDPPLKSKCHTANESGPDKRLWEHLGQDEGEEGPQL